MNARSNPVNLPLASPPPDPSPLPEPDHAAPLCLDLDGTLLKTDLLFESLARMLRTNPWAMVLIPVWLLRGKAVLKRELARRADIDVESLPYNQELLDWATEQRRGGRPLWLVTGADELHAHRVAAQLGILDRVLASDGHSNLTGKAKLAAIQEHTGDFAYAGDSHDDLAVWQHATEAVAVGSSPDLLARVRTRHPDALTFETTRDLWKALGKALRVNQWPKNVLLFVPLMAAHQVLNASLVAETAVAALLFSLCASAQYVLNDLVDLESDRRHAHKRSRPFASGELSLSIGFALVPALLTASLAGAWLLSPPFAALLAGYFVLSLAYSLHVKRMVLLDTFLLSALYMSRVIAGHVVTGVAYSLWLLSFSFFLFLSLALSKRWMELRAAKPGQASLLGRGYQKVDETQVNLFGVCSAFLSTVVFILYLQSPDVKMLYRTPEVLWLLAPVYLYWLSRLWIVSGRGGTTEDPVLMVLKDRISYAVALVGAAILIAASADLKGLLN